jgi:adenylate cyclase
MTISRRTKRRLIICGVSVIAGAIVGEIYAAVVLMPDTPQLRTWLPGARAGALIAGSTSGLELLVIHSSLGANFRRLPFLRFLSLRVVTHTSLVVAMLVMNSWIGVWLGESFADQMLEPRRVLRNTIFSLVMFTVVLFAAQMRSLIGGRALVDVMLGRYYQPRQEERLFLLLDLKGSTPLSVRLGDKQFHEMLAAFFFDVDAPIVERGGEIYEYVGDAVIATWHLTRGDREQQAIEAAFAARDAVQVRSEWYRQKFGEVPALRAILHRGTVVAGECGDSKRQIVFRGETLNTLARLEGLAKALDKDIISSDSDHGLALPSGIRSTNLGEHELKGLPVLVRVVSLDRVI